MEMVSAVKMRRAQAAVLASRPYAERLDRLIGTLVAHLSNEEIHPLLARREINRSAVILITSDRGLSGSLNVNVIRRAATYLAEHQGAVSLLTAGKRGRDWMARRQQNIIADISPLEDRPGILTVAPLASVVIDAYEKGEVDAVYLVYNRYVSTTTQAPTLRQLLPVEPLPESGRGFAEFTFEPDPLQVLDMLLPRYVEAEIYEALLESLASEHSARMVAMHNATINAQDVIQSLTLSYNKARQASITKEILEISSGAEALHQG